MKSPLSNLEVALCTRRAKKAGPLERILKGRRTCLECMKEVNVLKETNTPLLCVECLNDFIDRDALEELDRKLEVIYGIRED